MSATTSTPPARKRRRPLWLALALLVLVGLVGWWVYGQIEAYRLFSAAKADLASERPQLAREKLLRCVKHWPSSGEVRFLAARAARKSGELGEAMRLLDEAAERNWVKEAIDLEKALLRAQVGGGYSAVKGFLAGYLKEGHPDELQVLEVITPLFLRDFEVEAVKTCIDRWLELRPQSAAAWRYRAKLHELHNNQKATAEAYRQLVQLDPSGIEDRRSLTRALLRINLPAEALPWLEGLVKEQPDDLEAHEMLARALYDVGRTEDARRAVTAILDVAPRSTAALLLRGRIELETGTAQRAATYLERALAREPQNRELLYTYVQCLSRLDRPAEREAARKRLAQVDADLARMAKLVRKIAANPNDPNPRREAGEIMLNNGLDRDGLRWLQSALMQDNNHSPTHRVLAAYYERKGEPNLAARHRALAEGGAEK